MAFSSIPHSPHVPALDLARLSIRDMWCLAEMFNDLANAATNFLNQPRVAGSPAEDYADNLCNNYFYAMHGRIIEEMRSRTPQDAAEAYLRAQTIISDLAHGDDFHGLLVAVSAAIAQTQHFGRAPV